MIHAFAAMGVPEHRPDRQHEVGGAQARYGRPPGVAGRLCRVHGAHRVQDEAVQAQAPVHQGQGRAADPDSLRGNFLAGRKVLQRHRPERPGARVVRLAIRALAQAVGCVPADEHSSACAPGRNRARHDPRAGALPVPPPSHKLRRVRQLRGRRFGVPYWYPGKECRVSRDGGVAAHLLRRPLRAGGTPRDMEPQGQLLRRPVRRHAAGRTADGPGGDRHRPAGAPKGKPGFDKFDFEGRL